MENKSRAFTLIELLVVVLIIGILAAIAIPQYEKEVEKSRAVQALVMVKNIAEVQETYYLANGFYAEFFEKLVIDVPGEDWMYEGRLRKKKLFSFSAYVPFAPGAIAIVTKRKESVGNKAEYCFMRFPQDNTIYCRGGEARDSYQVC